MTTLTVDINNEQEERILLAFLNSLKYNYHTNNDDELSKKQQEEILKREKDFSDGKTKAISWEEASEKYRI